MLNVEVFADEIFGFHVQQAVEKCLKAWLCTYAVAFPFTHDINRLLVMLRDAGAQVDALWWADEFTIFAQQARYEDGYLQPDAPLERTVLLQRVDSLAALVNGAVQRFEVSS